MHLGTRSLLVFWVAAALTLGSMSAHAGLWSILGKAATKSGSVGAKAGKLGIGLYALEDAAGLLARLPDLPKQAALAAHVSPEGHWTFLNKQGDTFTAAYPHEMERLNAALVPDMPGDGKLVLYLSEESAFAEAQALKSLPANAELNVVIGSDSYALVRGVEGAAALQARVRPNLLVDLTSQAAFEEAVFLLGRPLNKSNVRMLAIEPGGPKQLASVPMFNKAEKTTLVDRIDPASISSAFGKVRGQTVLITGRVEGDALHVVAAGGPGDALSIAKLRDAAEAADVNLVVLHQSSPRQPGARNWLWQQAEVEGLKDALAQTTYADFFNSLGTSRGALSVTATPDGYGRTLLQALPPANPSGSLTGDFVPWAGDVTGEWFGNIGVHAVSAFTRDRAREQELDARVIPGIPSTLQIVAFFNLIAGLIAYEVSWPWWNKIWPPENRAEYGRTLGYQAARGLRVLAYLLLFLPLIGCFAFAWFMLLKLWEAILAPVHIYRIVRGWFGGRKAA